MTPSLDFAVRQLRDGADEQLLDPVWLSHTLASAGLYDDGRPLYGGIWDAYLAPRNAPGLWQHPEEFAAFLIWVAARKPKTVVDIGCFYGYGTCLMGVYLSRLNPQARVLGIDVTPWWRDNTALLPGFAAERFKFTIATSAQIAGAEAESGRRPSYDLVFIDADHAYSSAKADWDNLGKRAKICAFHDIRDKAVRETPGYYGGVPRFWDELKIDKSVKSRHEFVRTDGVEAFGIGVVVNEG